MTVSTTSAVVPTTAESETKVGANFRERLTCEDIGSRTKCGVGGEL